MVPAAGVIGEAMVLLTLTRFVLEKTGGDSLAEVRDNLDRYRERIGRGPAPASAAGPGGIPASPAPARPAPGATTRARPWTSCSSGSPGAARPPPGAGSPAATGRSSIDLDEVIAAEAGRPIPAIFDEEGEAGFRARERAAVAALGPADPEPGLRRVISTGGGAPIDPRNRWLLYRGRRVAWLDAPAEVLAQRIRHSPNPRPLLSGPRPDREDARAGGERGPASTRRRCA